MWNRRPISIESVCVSGIDWINNVISPTFLGPAGQTICSQYEKFISMTLARLYKEQRQQQSWTYCMRAFHIHNEGTNDIGPRAAASPNWMQFSIWDVSMCLP